MAHYTLIARINASNRRFPFRQQLLEELANLAGLQEGPKDAFPDGTRYEYDSRFKTTFEITPSGKRFPVALVAGKFQRRSAKLETHKNPR